MNTNPHIIQTSPKGRQFKVVAVSKVEDSEKWINRVEKYIWKVEIIYLDNKERLGLVYGYDEKLIKTEEI